MNEKKIGCVQHDCQECKDRERQSVPAGLQNIDRSVIEQALEWVEAQPEPRMLGAAKIITSLREALAQPQTVQQDHYKELAALGWQAIECPGCGSSAQGYPRQAVQPLSEEQAKKLCAVGPVYAPNRFVERTGQEYRRELEAARLRGLRDGEKAHGITKGTT